MNNNKTTRISLSFDDGRLDNYRVVKEVLLLRNLKATFNITTAYIENIIANNLFQCPNSPLSIDNIKELNDYEIFEIAAHGHNHINTIEDWKSGIDKLKLWLGNEWHNHGIGIASPNCGITPKEIRNLYSSLSDMNILYVRIGLINQFNLLQRIIGYLARKTKNRFLFYLAVKNSLDILGKNRYVYSIPVLKEHTIEQIKYTIDKTIKHKKDCILMFHSIVKPDEEYYDSMWSWDYNKFIQLCDYLVDLQNKNQIEVIKTKEAFKTL